MQCIQLKSFIEKSKLIILLNCTLVTDLSQTLGGR